MIWNKIICHQLFGCINLTILKIICFLKIIFLHLSFRRAPKNSIINISLNSNKTLSTPQANALSNHLWCVWTLLRELHGLSAEGMKDNVRQAKKAISQKLGPRRLLNFYWKYISEAFSASVTIDDERIILRKNRIKKIMIFCIVSNLNQML